jgi:hypothetical protein
MVGPITLISLFGFTGISLILLPCNIALTYKALCKTSHIGINLKIFIMLLLPIPLFSWPILVLIGSTVFGFFYGLFCPFVRTCNMDYPIIFGGFEDVFLDIIYYIKKFWEKNHHNYYNFLKEYEEEELEGEPYDVKFFNIIIGLFLFVYGTVVGVIVFVIMWFVKLIPSIYKLYYELFKYYCDKDCSDKLIILIIFLIAIPLTPIAGVLTIFAYIGCGFYGGFICVKRYEYSLYNGIISICHTIVEVDKLTNYYIFGEKSSCLTCCKGKNDGSEN